MTSIKKEGAYPHAKEATVNDAMEKSRYLFLPNVVASHPVIGMMIAFETIYDVRIQVDSSKLMLKSPWMWGRETLTMVVSTISINVGSITDRATTHLLILGVSLIFYFIRIVVLTDIPTRSGISGFFANTIFTGTLCVTFIQFPEAFSGGNSEKASPVPY